MEQEAINLITEYLKIPVWLADNNIQDLQKNLRSIGFYKLDLDERQAILKEAKNKKALSD